MLLVRQRNQVPEILHLRIFSRLLTLAILDVDVELTSKLKNNCFQGICHATSLENDNLYF